MGAAQDLKPDDLTSSAFLELRRAIIALAEGAPTRIDLADEQLATALRTVEGQLFTATSQPPSAADAGRAGDSAGIGVFVMVRADRFEALRSRVGDHIAGGVVSALRDQILSAGLEAKVGRLGRGVVDFTFYAPNLTAAEDILTALHETLEQPVDVEGEVFALPITIGAAAIKNERSIVQASQQAEQALVQAEVAGAKLIIFCERQRADASERLQLMRDLRAGLSSNELGLAYQPKLNVRTDRIDSLEALVRWTHPIRGNVPPDHFIELAEDTGDIRRITEQVLALAIEDQAALNASGNALCTYINLSGRLVADEGFCRWMLQACAGAAGRIGVEITETAVIADPDRALRNLHTIAEAGISIAIDDYGSGLSSLAYLKALPANELKIDKAFVLGLSSSHRDPLIVRSTIDLAHALQMEVTAEGVDDPTALALLRVMGCDRAQGFLISRPLALEALLTFLQDHADGRRDGVSISHPLLSLSKAAQR